MAALLKQLVNEFVNEYQKTSREVCGMLTTRHDMT